MKTPAVVADPAATPPVLAAAAVMKTVTYDTYKIMLSLKVPIPMERGCFINVYMPQALQVLPKPTKMEGYGMFKLSATGSN